MRISRKRRPQKPLLPRYRVNEFIRVPEVRLLDAQNNNLGVMSAPDAFQRAQESGLDLVEINPKAVPPVCKIVDFTHFKYQREKEAKKQKVKSHVSDTKGIRLSVRISNHDMETRKNQAEKFLDRGDKVKAEIILRGRENARPNLAFEVIEKFFSRLSQNMQVKFEQPVAKQGNKITAVIVKT